MEVLASKTTHAGICLRIHIPHAFEYQQILLLRAARQKLDASTHGKCTGYMYPGSLAGAQENSHVISELLA